MMRPSAILQAPLNVSVEVTDELPSPEISLQIILIFMMKVNWTKTQSVGIFYRFEKNEIVMYASEG